MIKSARKRITFEEKLRIVNRIEKGERPSNVARSLNLSESTIRTIRNNADKIRESISNGASKSTCHVRFVIMENMEKLLIDWIIDNNIQMPFQNDLIKKKALTIFYDLKQNTEEGKKSSLEFLASKAWFHRFKKRYEQRNEKFDENETDNISSEFHNKRKHEHIESQKTMVLKSKIKKEKLEAIEVYLDPLQSSDSESVAEEEIVVPPLTIAKLTEAIRLARKLEDFILDNDPDIERSHKFRKRLRKCMEPYEKLLKELKKKKVQPRITEFFK